ncbi:hypothetical protein Sps_03990 [Shewanella psychrophila]|uniref:Uncharacterized protein n=1 Tax=Shewanella psychrophila TaxID=225848 RepID=A0A1S6HU81_9GAMM|nr:hypothetical protein [Shewanella psychrophila]AQS39105.1 hypothetical protein Sps_03990 [Shewanella psychrophila]
MPGHLKLLIIVFFIIFFSVVSYFCVGLSGKNALILNDNDWVFDVRHYVNNTDDYLVDFGGNIQGVLKGRLRFYNVNHYTVTFRVEVKELDKNKITNVNNEVNLNGVWDVEKDIVNFHFENFQTLKPMVSGSDEEFFVNLAINVLNRTFGEGQQITWVRGDTFVLNNINQSQIIFNRSDGT